MVRSLLTIGNALFSPIFFQSCSLIHESGSDNPFHGYRHSKFLGFGPTGNISLFRQELPAKKHFENADRQNDRMTNPQTDTSTDNKVAIAERSRTDNNGGLIS